MVLGALAASVGTYAAFLEIEPMRWSGFHHDRNVHYEVALEYSSAIRAGDIGRLAFEIDRARQWPPLHGVLAGLALWIGGHEAYIAVLPNIVAFVAFVVLCFNLTMRLAPRFGVIAGVCAASLALASPAHQAFATDVMLESLGAALSLFAIDAYIRLQDRAGLLAARFLGITLTLLLLEKYNYYLLIVIALGTTEILRQHQALVLALRQMVRRNPFPKGLPFPLLRMVIPCLLMLIATVASVWVMWTGGSVVEWGGLRISMRTLNGPLMLGWTSLLLAAILLWKPLGRQYWKGISSFTRTLMMWHGLPLAVYLLLPGRLGHFLSYVSPSNSPTRGGSPIDAVSIYANWIASDYHVQPWLAVLVIVLAAIGATRVKCNSALRVVVTWVCMGSLLTVLHPHHQSRFVHTWIAGVWILAGIGLVLVACQFRARVRLPVAILFAVLFLGSHAPFFGKAGSSQQAGHSDLGASTRSLSDAYLSYVSSDDSVAFVTGLPMKNLIGWSLKEAFPEREIEVAIAPADLHTPREMEDWFNVVNPDTIVLIDIKRGSPFFWYPKTSQLHLPGLVREVGLFQPIFNHDFEELRAEIQILKRPLL